MSHERTLTARELLTEAVERFGDDPRFFAYVCHRCGDIACAQDFIDVGAIPSLLGEECIGRARPVTGPDTGQRVPTLRGCTSAAYGLFSGPWRVDLGDGQTVHTFRMATREEADTVGLSARRYAARHTAEPYVALVRRQLAAYDLMDANDRIPNHDFDGDQGCLTADDSDLPQVTDEVGRRHRCKCGRLWEIADGHGFLFWQHAGDTDASGMGGQL